MPNCRLGLGRVELGDPLRDRARALLDHRLVAQEAGGQQHLLQAAHVKLPGGNPGQRRLSRGHSRRLADALHVALHAEHHVGVVGQRDRPAGHQEALDPLGQQAAIRHFTGDWVLPGAHDPAPQRRLVALILVVEGVVVVVGLRVRDGVGEAPAGDLVVQGQHVVADDLAALAQAEQRREGEQACLGAETALAPQVLQAQAARALRSVTSVAST